MNSESEENYNNEENGSVIELATTEQANKTKTFGDNDELPEMIAEPIVSKEAFKTGETVKIKKVFLNRFGKYALSVVGPTSETTGQVAIGNVVYAQLLERFGKHPIDWKNKSVRLQSEYFEGPRFAGYQVKLLD